MSLKARIRAIKAKARPVNRRDLLVGALNLVWTIPTALGLGGLLKFLRFEPPTTQATRFNLGSPLTFPPLPVYIEDAQIWLHRDADGYYAVDAICTHLGCTVYLQPDKTYYCRCHGSRFEADGDVIQGPATQPLHFLLLAWESGKLVVDRSQEVDSTFRLPASA
ncbi:MAG TPA: ubiquinol-cytochrome c reductase iron-sulfur subunit [Chloroflexi bacterium]|nr:ubiquinol-cytochrome c reductase iron-sulfur subunit [Chloroflexota bacterium]